MISDGCAAGTPSACVRSRRRLLDANGARRPVGGATSRFSRFGVAGRCGCVGAAGIDGPARSRPGAYAREPAGAD